MKITFCSGAQAVTGANFLIEVGGKKVLVDCGLIQGGRVCEADNFKPFSYNPASIDAVFITHAHIDHIGRLPRLVHQGFRGPIYGTAATRDITELNLIDSMGVFSKEGSVPLYSEADVAQAMNQWQVLPYHTTLDLGSLEVSLLNAGHILGSAMVMINDGGKKTVFTGDLGNSPTPLLPNTDAITDAEYLVMESVYGDRAHESRLERKDKLEQIIEDTVGKGGNLIIPAFSIERTQELLFEIEEMIEHSRIPPVPVYLDSPLAIKVTAIYKRYLSEMNLSAREMSRLSDGLFRFPQLRQTLSTEESKAIHLDEGPKIIIAGSGMSNGGRIIHHEKRYLSDPKNTLLLVGYQAAGSLGRVLMEGAKTVRILGDEVPVAARVANLSGYSAHKDSPALVEFVHQSADTLKKVLVVMGEPKSSLFLVQRLRDYLGLDAAAPEPGETVVLY